MAEIFNQPIDPHRRGDVGRLADPRQRRFLQRTHETAFCTAGSGIPLGVDSPVSFDGDCSLSHPPDGRRRKTNLSSAVLHPAGAQFPVADFLLPLEKFLARLFDFDSALDPSGSIDLPVLETRPLGGNHYGLVLDLADLCSLSESVYCHPVWINERRLLRHGRKRNAASGTLYAVGRTL